MHEGFKSLEKQLSEKEYVQFDSHSRFALSILRLWYLNNDRCTRYGYVINIDIANLYLINIGQCRALLSLYVDNYKAHRIIGPIY